MCHDHQKWILKNKNYTVEGELIIYFIAIAISNFFGPMTVVISRVSEKADRVLLHYSCPLRELVTAWWHPIYIPNSL